MSIHSSLKLRKNKVRSVLKRHERLAKLIRTEKWIKGMSIYGLQKINPPKLRALKQNIEEKKTSTSLGKIDMIQEHLRIKESKTKNKKSKKETTGRK